MGSSTTGTQQFEQTKDPWGPSQKYLKDIMSQSQSLYDSGAGSQLWQGKTVADLNPWMQQAFGMMGETAGDQAHSAGVGYDAALRGLKSDGITGAMKQPLGVMGQIASGQQGIGTGGMYGQLYGRSLTQNHDPNSVLGGLSQYGDPSAAEKYLSGMAAGPSPGQDNPYLKSMLEAQDARIGNRINSSMSGAGRYGSAGHADVMARSLAEADNPILAQAYGDAQNRALSASGLIDQSRLGYMNTRMNAANSLANSNRADLSGAMGALGGLTGVQGQNIANRLSAAGQQLGGYQRGQDQAQGWGSLLPSLSQQAYAPAQAMAGMGQYMQGRSQQELDSQRQLFDQAQQMPWTQLSRYQGGISGLSGLLQGMGTTQGTQTSQQTTNPGAMDWIKTLGSSLGPLLGLLSDRNEKTDIKKVGTSDETGLDIYSYRYKGDPKSYPKVVGPMAQDIEKQYPGSTDRIDGKLYVKPHAAGLLGAF